MNSTPRFCDQSVVLGNGIKGEIVAFESADPVNYYQAIAWTGAAPKRTIDGQLFLPPARQHAMPAIILVPGSLGVAPALLRHAKDLTECGYAAFVIDPFGARAVTSTVANQAQYSFAASAFDVCAALRVLAQREDIDHQRIGAQGHSRGGSAVITAAHTRFKAPLFNALGASHVDFRAVLAAYPWCGHQFIDPDIGATELFVLMGERDDWCSPQQAQGCVHAIRARGGKATMKLVAGARHGFDRGTAVERFSDAAIAPQAPLIFLANDGAMVHPLSDQPDPALTDLDTFRYGNAAGFGARGATLGSNPGEAELFDSAMLSFWRRVFS